MTIDDQIKDEKLQYDINREAAKISALSSGKFDKYEYLTGEEILPSNNQKIIEQAKFEYSPLGKAFEKQVKTIADQGKKQIESLENLKLKEITRDKTKPVEYNNYFINELAKFRKSIEPANFDNLIYYYKGSNELINFSECNGMMNTFKSIHSGDKTLEDIEQEQNKFKKETTIIKQRNPKKRSEEQQETIDNIENLYKSRQKVVNMFNNYTENISKSIHEAKHEGRELRILTSNQMFKRLPIALAQIKAGNNSESLLNEIRKIVYYLYRSKKITKVLYNNIINSIKA